MPTLSDAELTAHRPALFGHCYRMLGSPVDADDAVQDTLLRAMRGASSFDGRCALRAWLLRIATNVCLDEHRRRRRRLPMEAPPGRPGDAITFLPPEEWVEPAPEAWCLPADLNPHERAVARESIRLAFVAALQHLPPRQRAALLLTQVLGWSAAEVAEALGSSVASVNSALQRARATLAALDAPSAAGELEVVERYARAFEAYDVEALARLLTEDVTFCMPPIPLWLRGPGDVAAFLRGPGAECEGSVLVPVSANGSPAFAQYRHGGRTPWGLVVLELRGARIAGLHTFLDVARLFPLFGLPPRWEASTFSPGADESRAAPSSLP